jgi:hypothetical protein
MKLVADARLKYLEANPDAFLEVFGITGSVPSPINAPMSPIRRPRKFASNVPSNGLGGGL